MAEDEPFESVATPRWSGHSGLTPPIPVGGSYSPAGTVHRFIDLAVERLTDSSDSCSGMTIGQTHTTKG